MSGITWLHLQVSVLSGCQSILHKNRAFSCNSGQLLRLQLNRQTYPGLSTDTAFFLQILILYDSYSASKKKFGFKYGFKY